MTGLLACPDPAWPARAQKEIARWADVLGPILLACHHIGSTSVPGLAAKPILDLLPVVGDLAALDAATPRLIGAGYEALGTFGLPGRRYFRRSGPDGTRLIHAHAYAMGDPAIARHLAFRDLLLTDPDTCAAYEKVKRSADAAAQGDISRYMQLKDTFVKEAEARALARFT